jgi:uncharacterized protein YjbJ (UPF0337 family)
VVVPSSDAGTSGETIISKFFNVMSASDTSPVNSLPGPSTPGGELEQIAPFAWPPAKPKPAPESAVVKNNAPGQVGLNDSVPCVAESLRDNWERVKDNLQRQFGELTDEDLLHVEQLEEAVVDHIREKTGRSREEIIKALHAAITDTAEKEPADETH